MSAHDYLFEFNRWRAIQDGWAARQAELWRFVHGQQFTGEEQEELKRLGYAAIPINLLFPAMEQAIALLTARPPGFSVTAREDSDRKRAAVLGALLQYIWNQSMGQQALKTAVRDYYVVGRGVLKVYWDPHKDYGRGEVCIEALNPFAVYPSPYTQDQLWRDADAIYVRHVLTSEQILKRYPDAQDLLDQATLTDFPERYLTLPHQDMPLSDGRPLYQILERYELTDLVGIHLHHSDTLYEETTFEREEEVLNRPAIAITTGDQTSYATTPQRVAELSKRYQEGEALDDGSRRILLPPPEPGMPPAEMILRMTNYQEAIQAGALRIRRAPIRQTRYTIIIGTETYWEGFIPTNIYPIVPIQSLWSRTPYPQSDVEFVREPQRLLNKLVMLLLANIQTGNTPKILVPRGSINTEEWFDELRRPGVAILQYDPPPEGMPPTLVAPQPLPSSLIQTIDMLSQTIERKLGVFSLMQGDPSQAPYTYRGTLAIDEFGQRRIRSKLDDIEMSLTQLARAALQLAQHYYTYEKTFRIIAPNGTEQTYTINAPFDELSGEVIRISDIATLQYDVVIVSGSTLPSNRWLLQDYYMQLYQLGIIDDIEVLKKTEVIDVEGVMARKSRMAQLMQQLQMATDQIERLTSELTQLQRENVGLRKRVEVEKFKRQLADIALTLRKAQQLYEARLEDQRRLKDLEDLLQQRNGQGQEMDTEGNQAPRGLFS